MNDPAPNPNPGPKLGTIAFLLDRDQIDHVLEQLMISRQRGSKCALILSTTETEDDGRSGEITSEGLDNIPVPELLCVGTIITIGLASPPEQVVASFNDTGQDYTDTA